MREVFVKTAGNAGCTLNDTHTQIPNSVLLNYYFIDRHRAGLFSEFTMRIGDEVILKGGSRTFIIELLINGEALLKKEVAEGYRIVDWYLTNTLKVLA